MPSLFHTLTYSAAFALFFSSAILMLMYAVYFEAFKRKQASNKKAAINQIIFIFLLAGISFLLFGLFSIYVMQLHFPDIKTALPPWVFSLAKYSGPLSLSCFITMFIKLVPFKSLHSFEFWLKEEKLYKLLYALDAIVIVALVFIQDPRIVVALSLMLYIPHCLAGATFSFRGLSSISLSKFYGVIFLVVSLGMLSMVFMTIFIGLAQLPSWVMSTIYLSFGFAVLMLSFVIIQFNQQDLTEIDGSSSTISMKEYFSDIYYALQRNEFYMVYQPKVSLKDGQPSGVEGLIRWKHAKKGNVPPIDFIPLAEKSEIIDRICEWSITQIVQDAKHFLAAGIDIPISINFSVKNLHPMMVNFLYSTLKKHGLPTSAVIIEITESLFLQHSHTQTQALQLINDYGFKLSLDDYGAGFSSLSYLDKLGIDEIKIDKSFILNKSNKNMIIIKSTIQMGHALGISVVAEGIEDEDTQQTLKRMHCDHAQGFGIAKPMPIDQLLGWLHGHRA